jgi:polysaccharide deacetylase family protein (PEP-CTERM system associated)
MLPDLLLEHHRFASDKPRNAMTVDVEEYFQVAAFERQVQRGDWEQFPARVADNTARVLDLFSEHHVCATFFVLGWVAERHPELIQRMVRDGHEVASHGYDHTRATELDREAFRQDVVRTKGILEDATGRVVRGYRAPSYSIGEGNLWALDVLHESGHVYSSSIYPIRHDLYGMPRAPRFAFRPSVNSILELPVTTVEVAGRKLPAGGGGYFRLLPYSAYCWALRRVNSRDRQPGIFYFHPWEVDPEQPRMAGASLRSRFRHYVNLDTMETRLRRLVSEFEWGRMDEVFDVR